MPVSAVFDTNILVSALLSPKGVPHMLLQELHAGRFQIVVSPPLQTEYETVLARPVFSEKFGLTEEELTAFLRLVARRAEAVEIELVTPVDVRDPHDVHVLATALQGPADYLVTGDIDLLSLAADEKITPLRIVTPRVFLTALAIDAP